MLKLTFTHVFEAQTDRYHAYTKHLLNATHKSLIVAFGTHPKCAIPNSLVTRSFSHSMVAWPCEVGGEVAVQSGRQSHALCSFIIYVIAYVFMIASINSAQKWRVSHVKFCGMYTRC
jgi:hypothetical protein